MQLKTILNSIEKDRSFEPVLKGSRWSLLKRPENLTEKQEMKLSELYRNSTIPNAR